VKEITEIFNELSVVRDNIDDEDRVVYLLASQLELYKMLVTALDVPDMETVVEHLLHEEQKMKEKDQGSSSTRDTEEAMSGKHKKRPLRCHFCNRFGHIRTAREDDVRRQINRQLST